MNTTELTSISEDELFFDVHQNNSLTSNKNTLKTTQTSENDVSYMSIVDSIDYLGCINGNCSKIECKCKDNEPCNCPNKNGNNGNNINNRNNGNNGNNGNNANNANNFISKLIDFLFIVLILILIIHIVYNKTPYYLIHCLGITLIYIFYKMYITTML